MQASVNEYSPNESMMSPQVVTCPERYTAVMFKTKLKSNKKQSSSDGEPRKPK